MKYTDAQAEHLFIADDPRKNRLPNIVKLVAQLYQYESTAILPASFIFGGFFFLIAGVWVGLFQLQPVIDFFQNVDLTGTIGYTAFLLAIIYKMWFDKAMRDYIRQPLLLYEALVHVRDASRKLSTFARVKYEDDPNVPDMESRLYEEQRRALARVFGAMITLAYCTRALFWNKVSVCDPDVPRALYEYIRHYTVTPALSGEVFDAVCSYHTEEFARLKRLGVIDASHESELNGLIDKLTDIRTRLQLMKNVKNPGIFENHLFFVVLVYFIFFVPVQIYQQVEWFLVAIYPLVCYLYFGISFYSAFVGRPFSKYARMQSNDFMMWWGITNAAIRTHAKRAFDAYVDPKAFVGRHRARGASTHEGE